MMRFHIRIRMRAILRDPSVLLAMFASLIMHFVIYRIESCMHIDGTPAYYGVDGTMLSLVNITNFSNSALHTAFVFLGILIAADFFRERRNGMDDLLTIGQTPPAVHYLARIVSYYVIGLMFCLAVTVAKDVLYIAVAVPNGANIAWGAVVLTRLLCVVGMFTSCLLVPIGLAVFLSALCDTPVVGALFNCVVTYIPSMFGLTLGSFYVDYIGPTPLQLFYYLNYRFLPPDTDDFIRVVRNLSLEKAALAFGLQSVIAAFLLVGAYFIRKKRES